MRVFMRGITQLSTQAGQDVIIVLQVILVLLVGAGNYNTHVFILLPVEILVD